MQSAKVDAQVGEGSCRLVRADSAEQFLDAHRSVIMDARLFGSFQIGVRAVGNPTVDKFLIPKTYSTDGSCRVSMFASFRARGILTQQTAAGLFIDIHSLHINYFLTVQK